MKQLIYKLFEKSKIFAFNILLLAILVLLFRGCAYVLGPSKAEKTQKQFLETFLEVDEKTWQTVGYCQSTDFAGDFTISEDTKISCNRLYNALMKKFRSNSLHDSSTNRLIEAERPNWLKHISELNLELKSRNIDVLYEFLEDSVHFCVASTMILSNGLESDKIPNMCVSMSSGCLNDFLSKEIKDIKYPCDPFSGMKTLTYFGSSIRSK